MRDSGLRCYLCGVPASTTTDTPGLVVCVGCAQFRSGTGLDRTPTRDDDGPPLFDRPDEFAPGGHSWEWRPQQREPDDHHEEPFVINGELMFRQSPPVHSTKVRHTTDPKQARYIGQNRRQRRALLVALVEVGAEALPRRMLRARRSR